MRRLISTAALLVCGQLPFAFAAGPVAESQVFIRDAVSAYQSGDLSGYVSAMESALELNPASLSSQYNLACGYALTGRTDDAIRLLEQLARTGMDFGQARDPELDTLRDDPRFAALLGELEDKVATLASSEAYFEFPQLGVVPEGIAHDASSGRFFFSSMRTGDVYALGDDRRVSRFASLPTNGRMSAIGLTVDAKRGLLWVAAAAFDLAEGYQAEDAGRSGLFGFDLVTGALQREYPLENSGFGLNDVAIGPDGQVFTSGQALRRLDEDAGTLLPVDTSIELFATNGITVHDNGRTIFTSSYPVGVATVDLLTGDARFLDVPAELSLYGVDGLYWHVGHLYAVQNGARPWRLLRLTLNDGLNSVVSADILELGNPATTPMTGAIVGDTMFYVGEGADPDAAPTQFPANLQQNLGTVVIRSVPIDP